MTTTENAAEKTLREANEFLEKHGLTELVDQFLQEPEYFTQCIEKCIEVFSEEVSEGKIIHADFASTATVSKNGDVDDDYAGEDPEGK